ncbi:DNA-binding transcriptional LysR family regulator [Paraburkholderia sp. GAS348]|nr:LysR substrate-binding domain-containing protein [Paraburkholderia phytofirmans]
MAIASVKKCYPQLQIWAEVETSDMMLPKLAEGELDIMIGRVLERQNPFRTEVRYEPLVDEPPCVVARPGHPFENETGLTLRGIVNASWVLHPPGSVLRHRFDLMFSQIGLNPPQNVVNTNNFLAISSLLLQSDMLAVLPDEVARQYQQYGVLKQVPIDLPCKMDTFGIITRPVAPAFACGLHRARSLAGSRGRGLRQRFRAGSGAINASPVAIVAVAAGFGSGGTRDVQQTPNTATRRRRLFFCSLRWSERLVY